MELIELDGSANCVHDNAHTHTYTYRQRHKLGQSVYGENTHNKQTLWMGQIN